MAETAVRKPRRTKTVDSILGSRPRRVGLAYKLAPGFPSLALDIAEANPVVDRGAMTASATISTPTVDRYGDMLNPLGCRLENYKKNPVVLWAHGFEGITVPLGTSNTEDGELSVVITEEQVIATCRFSQSLPEAAQIFELIDEGIVKATSVRETPLISSYQRHAELGDVLIVDEWDLEEWSWCCVGVNPDAVSKALDKRKLDGRPIAQSILKSLIAVAPTLKRYGKGFTEAPTTKDSEMKLSPAFLKSLTLPALKALKADNPDDEAVDEEMKNRKAADDETPDEDRGSAGDGNVVDDEPYGSKVLKAIHTSLSSICDSLSASLGPLEQAEAKAAVSEIMTSLKDHLTAVEGLHSSIYADRSPLKSEGEPDADEESLKSFLATGMFPQLQITGIGARLKTLATSKNLTRDQKQIVAGAIGHLSRMVAQAKALQAKQLAEATPDPAIAKSAEDAELAKLQADILKFKETVSA